MSWVYVDWLILGLDNSPRQFLLFCGIVDYQHLFW